MTALAEVESVAAPTMSKIVANLETMSPADRDTVDAGLRLLSTALAPGLDSSDRQKDAIL
ncbi:hypothetical protein L5G28_10380 [Gordonia sp. HY285]|uniref:hypothetical protein n=1 Tax=Gordonia liuliyuniae TaxID=2911517 RepID=UPI001F20402E|nr:hypothetical protein [Gordonia liuliyuniae]MCF8610557.1 hypothetical protein [Gordonia liuliyuniae]